MIDTVKRQNAMLENETDTIWLTFCLLKGDLLCILPFLQRAYSNENGKKQFML